MGNNVYFMPNIIWPDSVPQAHRASSQSPQKFHKITVNQSCNKLRHWQCPDGNTGFLSTSCNSVEESHYPPPGTADHVWIENVDSFEFCPHNHPEELSVCCEEAYQPC
eukprot:GHVN01042821.1.p1 GENE.GHVN01042821.1~~GHVN01042821.1.p1  ORF type:complete len:108 (+),score=8.73 GHVN01042821.1:333-656(+)